MSFSITIFDMPICPRCGGTPDDDCDCYEIVRDFDAEIKDAKIEDE